MYIEVVVQQFDSIEEIDPESIFYMMPDFEDEDEDENEDDKDEQKDLSF